MEIEEKQKKIIEEVKAELKILNDIVETKSNEIVGYNKESSSFNKGINIMLKRN